MLTVPPWRIVPGQAAGRSVPSYHVRPLDRQRDEHASFAKHPDCASSGGEGYPVLSRKVTLGREPGTRLQFSGRDAGRDVVGHSHVQIAGLSRARIKRRHSAHMITVTRV